MKVGDTVKIVRGTHNGVLGQIKSKDHSYRNFGVKKYGLRFAILMENGTVVTVDANDVKPYKDEVKFEKSKLENLKKQNDETTQAT